MTLPQFPVRRFAALAIQYRMLRSSDSQPLDTEGTGAGCPVAPRQLSEKLCQLFQTPNA
jgi:hypothetical protein